MINKIALQARIHSSISIDPATGCWNWERTTCRGGYGNMSVDDRKLRTHRVSYEVFRGPIPKGLQIDHLCRNRLCCNPDHLEPVTRRENIRRGTGPTAVNMAKTSCNAGHPLSGTNLRINRQGQRICRACHRINAARHLKKLSLQGTAHS